MKDLIQLYLTFLKIGAVSFGGGYAMLPILSKEFCEDRDWATDEELNDYFAIGQVTPGIIAVNVATFIGNKRKGFIGGIVATLGLVSAPLVIIALIAALLSNFAEYELVKHAFAGIRVCVCLLVLNAIFKLWSKSVVDIPTFIICAVLFGLSAFGSLLPIDISPVILVIIAGVVGVILQSIRAAKNGKGGKKE